jgi:hypothetical protein
MQFQYRNGRKNQFFDFQMMEALLPEIIIFFTCEPCSATLEFGNARPIYEKNEIESG